MTLYKLSFGHGCPPINLLYISRTSFPKNTLRDGSVLGLNDFFWRGEGRGGMILIPAQKFNAFSLPGFSSALLWSVRTFLLFLNILITQCEETINQIYKFWFFIEIAVFLQLMTLQRNLCHPSLVRHKFICRVIN